MLMGKLLFSIVIGILLNINLSATNFTKVATIEPKLLQQGKQKQWCPICGMSIKKFYKTSYATKLPNGTKRQYCSLRCLVVDMKTYNLDKNSIVVVDAKTQKLINANDAFYVVGSKISGTMTKVSKLPLSKKLML